MKNVHLLPPEIVSKIAAGEVIERPASVVKELLENALDAQADSVVITLKEAGKTLINIKDTGIGITHENIQKLFMRHATSKIKNVDDLYSIASLGFRGEALYSIAAISDVLLRSHPAKSDAGSEIHVRGGEQLSLKPASMSRGTEVEVKELFFNTPARKKFLKSNTAELHAILNVVIPYTLLYPEKRFVLVHGKKTLIDLTPEKDRAQRIARALNLDAEHILSSGQRFPEQNINVHLTLGNINIQRARKDMQFIFVNGRPVANHTISYHLNNVYRSIFPGDRHPFFVVDITLPAEDIDVNVHPTKREVRIKSEFNFISLIRRMTEETLMSRGAAKQIDPALGWGPQRSGGITKNITPSRPASRCTTRAKQPISDPGSEMVPEAGKQYALDDLALGTAVTGAAHTPPALHEPQGTLKNKLAATHYVGSFLRKYLFFESGSSLLVVDQHAAHERVTFEKLLNQLAASRLEVQHLLTPFTITVSAPEKVLWETMKGDIEKLGFTTTLFNDDTVAVHTHPQLIADPEIAVRTLLTVDEDTPQNIEFLARRACRGSVMAGQELSAREALALRTSLVRCKDPFTCPHGRPTVVELKETTLEKYFLRT